MVKPDDTVVVRVVRSEMGQGTLTGLCQLVAEELDCNWDKVTWEYPTPGQSVARKRVWGNFSTGGSRGIRMSHEYVRQGGAVAREMLKQAAANEWKVPVAEADRRQGRDHAQGVEPHHHLRQGRGRRRQARVPDPKSMKLKDPKDWKIAGKPLKRLDTARPRHRQGRSTASDVKLPGMLMRRDQGMPGAAAASSRASTPPRSAACPA